MALMARYDPPADLNELPELGRQSWSDFLGFNTEQFASRFTQ